MNNCDHKETPIIVSKKIFRKKGETIYELVMKGDEEIVLSAKYNGNINSDSILRDMIVKHYKLCCALNIRTNKQYEDIRKLTQSGKWYKSQSYEKYKNYSTVLFDSIPWS